MSTQHVLIIDDEPDIRELLEITLIRMGLETQSASNVAEAKQFLSEQDFQLCLTDMNLPDGNGIDLVAYIQQTYNHIPVAMITAYGSVETAISALKAGAFDFISKPVDLSQLRDLVTSALKLSNSASPVSGRSDQDDQDLLIGQTPQINKLKAKITKQARSQAPIYISGESGCGKELVARMIHEQGPRADAPFIPVNCGAIPSELMESEFFGHMKGSFSGAVSDKEGLFKAAQGGTLFLDEVADLPLAMQVKLLRAIQEKSIRPVGGHQEEAIDVRILSATHKDLQQLVDKGDFRQDLFYRINVIKLDVPSLKERADDIPLLTQHFLTAIAQECQIENARIDAEAMAALEAYEFPGNVRELENIIERAFTLCEDDTIQVQDLQLQPAASVEQTAEPEPVVQPLIRSSVAPLVSPSADSATSELPRRQEGQSLEDYLEAIEKEEIEAALQATKWNRTAAAKELGISFRALRYRLKKLGLD